MRNPSNVVAAWGSPLALFIASLMAGSRSGGAHLFALGLAGFAVLPGFFTQRTWVRVVAGVNALVTFSCITGMISESTNHTAYSGLGYLVMLPMLGLAVILAIAAAIGLTAEYRAPYDPEE